MREKILFISLGLVLVFSFVSASFDVGVPSHLIETQYSPYGTIKGWINTSFNNEPADSIFEDSFGNSLSLLDLLKTNSDINYVCNPIGCLPNYEASNLEQTKSFSLNPGEKKIIGFKITEDIVNVNSVTFNLESDVIESCTNQLEIDFLREGNADIVNNKVSNLYCSSLKNYGCFNPSESLSNALIDYQSYCQK